MATRGLTDSYYALNRHVKRFTVVDSDNGNAALNLTSRVVRFTLSRGSGEAPFLSKTSPHADISFPDAVNGVVDVAITETEIDNCYAGPLLFQLEVLTTLGTQPVVVAEGTDTILPNLVEPA